MELSKSIDRYFSMLHIILYVDNSEAQKLFMGLKNLNTIFLDRDRTWIPNCLNAQHTIASTINQRERKKKQFNIVNIIFRFVTKKWCTIHHEKSTWA